MNIGWLRAFLFILAYFGLFGVLDLIYDIINGVDFFAPPARNSIEDTIELSIINLFSCLIVLWFFMRFIDKESFISVGYKIKRRGLDIIVGISFGLVSISLSFLILIYLNEIQFVKINFNIKHLLYIIIIYLIVGFVEETFVRGYVLRNLFLSYSKIVALIITSVFFTILHLFNAHLSWVGLLHLLIAGFLYGIIYMYTKNLWLVISMHFSWNLFQSLFGFNVSGHDKYSLIEHSYTKENLLNGGGFGLEGSVLGIIPDLILIVVTIYYFEKIKLNRVVCVAK